MYDLGTEIRRWSEFLAIKLKGYQPECHTPEDWSRQYQDGAWAYLADLSERARYSVIAGYMAEIEPDRILDVGCGEGLLARGIQHLSFRSYVGIDFSPAAVARRARGSRKTSVSISQLPMRKLTGRRRNSMRSSSASA